MIPCRELEDNREGRARNRNLGVNPRKDTVEGMRNMFIFPQGLERIQWHNYKENDLRNILCEHCPCAFEKSYMHLLISSNKILFISLAPKKVNTVPPLD